MTPIIDIIIPTWNNPEYLNPCVSSIAKTGILGTLARIIIVNNGKQPCEKEFAHMGDKILVLTSKENLGWEGGLALGLKHSQSPFVCLQNDDTFIPQSMPTFYQRLLIPFADKNVAAVGPVTTVAAGLQSIYHPASPIEIQEASYLIFFTVMVRRKDLDEVGGVDTTLPGGDDFDLSIRFRKAGKKLIIKPDAFIIHHGFVTGTRVRGSHSVKRGWNSAEMRDETNHALILKHGFKDYFQTFNGLDYSGHKIDDRDLEGELVRQFLNGHKEVLELGCGYKKTVPFAKGIDRVPNGQPIPHVPGGTSVADVIADITLPLPFKENSQDAIIARHVLEHCIDSVQTIKNWRKVLRLGGRLIIAVPDEAVTTGIPLNPEHCHAFTQMSLSNLMESLGFKCIATADAKNGVSFVGVYEKC